MPQSIEDSVTATTVPAAGGTAKLRDMGQRKDWCVAHLLNAMGNIPGLRVKSAALTSSAANELAKPLVGIELTPPSYVGMIHAR